MYIGELNKNYRHGFTKKNTIKREFYDRWSMMKIRCYNKKYKSYKNYGGRGIKVCNDWLYFKNFLEDMFDSFMEHFNKYGKKDTTLDRIDVNKNYSKDNCRWATKYEQNGSKTDTLKVRYKNKLYTTRELSKILKIPRVIIYSRIRHKRIIDSPYHPILKVDNPSRQILKNVV